MVSKKDICVILPAYNEAQKIKSVINKISTHGFPNIVVIDDCSKDNTADIATTSGATVIKHPINRGAGAATKTGIDYAISKKYKYVLTLDADGQHDIADAENLLKEGDKYDVIIGSRLINPKGMPFSRQIINRVGSILTFLIYGIYLTDSQSGFKLFNEKAMKNIEIKFDRYEFCSEVLHEIKQKGLTHIEVPIKAIYTEYSLSKGQSLLNGVRMIYKMVMRFFLP